MSEVQEHVDKLLREVREARVLEAGCGSASRLALRGRVHVTGIDISQKQLDRNNLLQERICADIETYSFPAEAYDLIVCWDVLEHLSDPQRVLANFRMAIRPGGLIVVAVPNVWSFIGLATKFTPFWFHEWFHRAILKCKSDPGSDKGPFKTYLRGSLAPYRMRRFAARNDLHVHLSRVYARSSVWDRLRAKRRGVYWLVRSMSVAVTVLSVGCVLGDQCSYVVVMGASSNDPRAIW